MTKQQIKDHILTKWLKSKKAYSMFVRNTKHGDMEEDYESLLENIGTNRLSMQTAISSAFLWLSAPESKKFIDGHRYWSNMCSDWISFHHSYMSVQGDRHGKL